MEIAFKIVVLLILGWLLLQWSKTKPLWEKVYDDIEELHEVHKRSMNNIEDYLQNTYNLTEQQARLCVNNYGSREWFKLQSFLEY
jgi:hypothetical protein